MIGKIGRVTGPVAPGSLGEVMLPARGGTEAFYAWGYLGDEVLATGARVMVMDFDDIRTVWVVALNQA